LYKLHLPFVSTKNNNKSYDDLEIAQYKNSDKNSEDASRKIVEISKTTMMYF